MQPAAVSKSSRTRFTDHVPARGKASAVTLDAFIDCTLAWHDLFPWEVGSRVHQHERFGAVGGVAGLLRDVDFKPRLRREFRGKRAIVFSQTPRLRAIQS